VNNQNQNNWANELVAFYFQREALYVEGAPPVDESLAQLEEFRDRGYSAVIWLAPNAQDSVCADLNNSEWPIDEFIAYTKYDAPVFSKSHVGCKCFLKVLGKDKLTGEDLPQQIIVAF
jgi:hypothetical protein